PAVGGGRAAPGGRPAGAGKRRPRGPPGGPSTRSSPASLHALRSTDSLIVERIRAAGAIFIGKTNTPEFGLGSQTYNKVFGTTFNAYDQTKTAGGSSGGAAVAVALRMLPVADGSDFMGSLRNPPGWNNVFGLRPEALLAQSGGEGPIARDAAELALCRPSS